MATVEFEVDEFKDHLDSWLNEIVEDDYSEALEACSDPIAGMFSEIFTSQVDSQGSAWAPHAPSTVSKYGEHPLLILHEVMYASLTSDGPEHVEEIVGNELLYGTSVVYGPTQNFGDASRNIPAREFMYFTEDGRDKCAEVIMDYVDEKHIAGF